MWLTWVLWFRLASAHWDTVYNLANQTVYIRPSNSNSTVLQLQFDDVIETNQTLITTIASPPSDAKLVSNVGLHDGLFAVYPNEDYTLEIQWYDAAQDLWKNLSLSDTFEFYSDSSYLTGDDEFLYVYGGSSLLDSSVSNRLLKIDLASGEVSTANTTVTPANFYGAASVPLDESTTLVVGGKSSSGWVGLTQLALWEYSTWAFREVSSTSTINSRILPLVLPVMKFPDNDSMSFEADSVLMIGGNLSSSYSSPSFASLTLSNWSWTDLDTTVSVSNSLVNNEQDSELSLDSIVGAATVFETLIVVHSESGSYAAHLYNASTLRTVDSMDYHVSSHSHSSNRSLVIVLSVVIPIFGILLIAVLLLYLYRRHKHTLAEREKELELKNALEYYNHIAEKHSIASMESDAKPDQGEDDDSGDDFSIGSWRRKREEYDRAHVPRHAQPEQAHVAETASFLKRSLSSVSSNVGRLGRSFSYQSSVRSAPQPPHASLRPETGSTSTLYLIPESASVQSGLSNETRVADKIGHSQKGSVDFDDADYDVQILVSSKRKSKLRVVNPDPETRRRNVSDEKREDEDL
ncbi:unnamed protein product [Kuraishia capsulata CBS 1993]|uniref:Uncharacterized protein n=1 Tax=Kuraishia capsulata CBS 1993 TaxID=1382522 RepID=W6MG02_9ASCO|nr:uncharacterized protein KUCA_T00000314001 [Kuraishia capsulata CBS 1993]CDK24353.1 unnamed protein product [Kuraishia capsulata CBS 1993]